MPRPISYTDSELSNARKIMDAEASKLNADKVVDYEETEKAPVAKKKEIKSKVTESVSLVTDDKESINWCRRRKP